VSHLQESNARSFGDVQVRVVSAVSQAETAVQAFVAGQARQMQQLVDHVDAFLDTKQRVGRRCFLLESFLFFCFFFFFFFFVFFFSSFFFNCICLLSLVSILTSRKSMPSRPPWRA
jgi:hypothetical protein